MIVFIVAWIFFSFIVALFGAGRSIGFTKSFFAAIFLTPLIGMIIAAFSKSKKEVNKKKEINRLSKEYLDLINPKK